MSDQKKDAEKKVKTCLLELMRMPTGDKMSLKLFYEEAQRLVRFSRDSHITLPGEVTRWLGSAEERARDPIRSATESADIARYLSTLA
ncbi:MAG: hypothetical protein DI536_01790 [Archangium gephyra]|uniref:Uncharacterized protein n=1 Tax=Archangium gephyra TaxID=48 RepID=A0A2W5TWX9_9BACT|nr:MAG: hypothetical protein DI536_01790 [Archangium gephyra]